jgi:YHS domain-containing protein
MDLCLESDVEEFEDNPEEYIRKDIEKSGKLINYD